MAEPGVTPGLNSDAAQRVAEEVVTTLWTLSLHEQRVEVVATALAQAVAQERERCVQTVMTWWNLPAEDTQGSTTEEMIASALRAGRPA